MDFFYLNKVAMAVLASLLFVIGLRTAIDILYPTGRENLPKGKIPIIAAPAPSPAAAPAETQDPPIDSLLPAANLQAGENAMKQCAACHSWTKGSGDKIGPNLYDVVGRDIGKEPGYAYSSGVAKKGGKWTFENLYEWLKNPKAFVPGTKMTFAGVKDPKERAGIIAYLEKQSDNPVPLPQKSGAATK